MLIEPCNFHKLGKIQKAIGKEKQDTTNQCYYLDSISNFFSFPSRSFQIKPDICVVNTNTLMIHLIFLL